MIRALDVASTYAQARVSLDRMERELATLRAFLPMQPSAARADLLDRIATADQVIRVCSQTLAGIDGDRYLAILYGR